MARALRELGNGAGREREEPGVGPEAHAIDDPEKARLREALRRALEQDPPPPFKELAAMMRKLTAGRKHTPSELLLRESRDER